MQKKIMNFINENILPIYILFVICIIILSAIKAGQYGFITAIEIMIIPILLMLFGILAGPLGSMIMGIVGILIIYFVRF